MKFLSSATVWTIIQQSKLRKNTQFKLMFETTCPGWSNYNMWDQIFLTLKKARFQVYVENASYSNTYFNFRKYFEAWSDFVVFLVISTLDWMNNIHYFCNFILQSSHYKWHFNSQTFLQEWILHSKKKYCRSECTYN